MATLKVGCNTVLLGMVSLEEALQHLAWAGYDGAELAALPSMADHVQTGQGQAYAERIKRLARELGLELYSIEASAPDPQRIDAVCQTAAELGIPVVAIGSGGKTGDEASFREAIEKGKQLAEIAGRHGVKLAMKPHVGAAVYNSATALRAWRAIGSPHLGLNFDPSHLHRAGEDVAQAARAFGQVGAIVHSHFRDCPWSEGQRPGSPEQQVPGRGEIDIPGVLRALVEVGYSGVISFEVIGTKAQGYSLSRAAMVAAEARGYLRRCLEELG